MAFQVISSCQEIAATAVSVCEEISATSVSLCASLNSWQGYTLEPGEYWQNVNLMWNFAE